MGKDAGRTERVVVIDAADGAELKFILAHNRDEKKEQLPGVLEWIRRRDAKSDEELRAWLVSSRALGTDASEGGPEDGAPPRPMSTRRTVGAVKNRG